MNYSTDFLCTYLNIESEYQETLYRCQILQAFMIKEWDDDTINKTTHHLYELIINDPLFSNIMRKIKTSKQFEILITFFETDSEIFKLLFHFDLFQHTHKCLCDLINDGIIKEKSSQLLIECL